MMPAATLISLEEYLHTSYRPDCDFVDGEVLERNLGEPEHSFAQAEILHYFRAHYPGLRRILPEQRIQVAASRFRIPDVCVPDPDAPREKIVRTPPMLCIEILSPEDRMSRVHDRVRDYFAIGVPVCWIIDPELRQGWIATPGNMAEATDGILRAGAIEMPLEAVLEPRP